MSEWIKKLSPVEARREVARRVAAFTADPRQAPIAAAAVGSLLAQGRRDFKDRAIREEIEALRGEIRGRFNFTDEERQAAADAWPSIEELVRSTSPGSFASYLFEESGLEALGISGGILWLGGPTSATYPLLRGWRGAIAQLAEADDVLTIEARE